MLDTESTNGVSIAEGGEPAVDVELHENWELPDLEQQWLALEEQAIANAFLSWAWIKPWLQVCSSKPLLITAKLNNTTVGLGLLHHRSQQLFPGLCINKLWLHRTGRIKEDQIWIEHNDFLLDKRYSESVRSKLVGCLLSEQSPFDEIFLGLVTSSVADQVTKSFPDYRTDISSSTYLTQLSGFDSLECYLASLSKNSRSQIVRSKKLLEEKYGVVAVKAAQSVAEKEAYLLEMAELHRQRWGASEYGSGFDNPIFTQFHRDLVLNDSDNQSTLIFCLQSGKQTLGYIYLLTDAENWKFYLSALNLEDDNRIKVGLLFHALVIEKAIQAGVKYYDFLAGEARYKNSLSDITDYQRMLCVYRPKPLLRLREKLRTIKRFWIKKKAYYINR